MNLSAQGRKNFDKIDWTDYCKCNIPALRGLLDKKKRLRCITCNKPIKKEMFIKQIKKLNDNRRKS